MKSAVSQDEERKKKKKEKKEREAAGEDVSEDEEEDGKEKKKKKKKWASVTAQKFHCTLSSLVNSTVQLIAAHPPKIEMFPVQEGNSMQEPSSEWRLHMCTAHFSS